MKKTIIITGTPGTGKTTIAKQLKKIMNNTTIINTTELAIKKELVTEYDYKRKTYTIDEDKLRMELNNLIKNREETTIIDTVYPCIIDTEHIDKVIILRTEPSELRKRLEKRKWPKIKIMENIESELMEQIKNEAIECHGKNKTIEINTTNKDPKQIAMIIKKIITKPITDTHDN